MRTLDLGWLMREVREVMMGRVAQEAVEKSKSLSNWDMDSRNQALNQTQA